VAKLRLGKLIYISNVNFVERFQGCSRLDEIGKSSRQDRQKGVRVLAKSSHRASTVKQTNLIRLSTYITTDRPGEISAQRQVAWWRTPTLYEHQKKIGPKATVPRFSGQSD
jgi:hypothetical protein